MHSTQMRGDSYGRRLLFACRCGLVLGSPNKQTNKRTEKTKLNTFRNINNIIALFIVDHWSLVVCISLGEMRAFALDILVMLLCMLVVDALCVCVFAITASELCILLRWPTNFISDQNVANRRKIYYTSAMYAPVVNNA